MMEYDPQTTFFSSDQHFGHERSLRRGPEGWNKGLRNVFDDLDEMERKLIEGWNLEVSEDSTVFVVGDYAYSGSDAPDEEVLDTVERVTPQLNGRLILIAGNHDLMFGDPDSEHEQHYLDAGFEEIIHAPGHAPHIISLLGHRFEVCHFPRETEPSRNAAWRIHGHTHARRQVHPRFRDYNVTLEAQNYRPVSAAEILLNTKEFDLDTGLKIQWAVDRDRRNR